MRYQPNRDYVSNDDVQTPPELARRLVAHFRPSGRILEPCRGDGHLLAALRTHARRTTGLGFGETNHRPQAGEEGNRRPRECAAAARLYWCEIKAGRDFFACRRRVDWIVTNPPWSQLRAFLRHAMTLADEVVFLVTINHLWTRARLRDIAEAGFGLREIVLVDTPATFPPSGFQLGAVRLSRGWTGDIALRRLDPAPERAR